MRNPEILPSYPEFRPELAPEQNLCLKSLLARVESRSSDDYDPESDDWLMDRLDESVVEADESGGGYGMECQIVGCEANCVMAISVIDEENTITIKTPVSLEACIEEA